MRLAHRKDKLGETPSSFSVLTLSTFRTESTALTENCVRPAALSLGSCLDFRSHLTILDISPCLETQAHLHHATHRFLDVFLIESLETLLGEMGGCYMRTHPCPQPHSLIDQPSFSVLCGGHKAIIHSHRAPSPTHGTGHQRCGHSQPHPLGEAPGARAAAEAVFP